MNSKNAREIMREHQSGFVKLNPRWCAIEELISDSEKLEKIEQIVKEWENSKIVTNCYECAEQIKEVLNG